MERVGLLYFLQIFLMWAWWKTARLSYWLHTLYQRWKQLQHHMSLSFWKTPLYTGGRMRVRKARTSLYYYENIFDLTDTPRPHFWENGPRVNKKQNQKQSKDDLGILKKLISQEKTKNFTLFFKKLKKNIIYCAQLLYIYTNSFRVYYFKNCSDLVKQLNLMSCLLMLVVLRVWFLDQQHQWDLRSC